MMQLEKYIKNKLNTFEYSDKASDWNEFEKKLPKQKISITKYFVIGAAATVLITLIGVYLLNSSSNDVNNKQITTIIPVKKSNIDKRTKKLENIVNDNIQKEEVKNTKIAIKDNANILQKQISNNKQIQESEKDITDNLTKLKKEKAISDNIIADNYQPKSSFHASSQHGCLPLNISFKANENHENISYKWEFSDGFTSNSKIVNHIFKKAGEYTVKLFTTYKNNHKTSISEQTITIYPIPKADFSYTKDEDAYYFDGPDNNELSWNFGDNTTTNEIDPEHVFKLIGETNIELTVKNEFGCISSRKEKINISPIFKIANAFSPDNNGFNDEFSPIFEYPENYDFELYIYNSQGKLYFKSSSVNQSWNGKINNTEQLAEKGYYLWKLIISDKYGNRIIKNGNLNIK